MGDFRALRSLIPTRISSQLAGQAFANPSSIAHCIANQSSGEVAGARPPKSAGKSGDWISAIAPYIRSATR